MSVVVALTSFQTASESLGSQPLFWISFSHQRTFWDVHPSDMFRKIKATNCWGFPLQRLGGLVGAFLTSFNTYKASNGFSGSGKDERIEIKLS